MIIEIVIVVVVCFSIAAIVTGIIRRWALRSGVVDVPNSRSSHTAPTPRGGGLAIVGASAVGWGWLTLRNELAPGLFLALTGGGFAIALIGYVDDRRQVPAGIRFLVHVAASAWALYCLGGVPPLSSLGLDMVEGWLLQGLGVLSIVWVINLFNFMDGIDGIAASEATFITCAGSCLSVIANMAPGVTSASLIIAAAASGFLCWNWPPARIFMGDVGSGYLGFVIAAVGMASARENPELLLVWLILGGAFFADATVTLLRRIARRERVFEAHRTHAYQWLARRWGSHRRVTLSVMAVNVFWLLPLAWLAARNPGSAHWIVGAALAPLVVVAFAAGAGRSEFANRTS